MSQFEADIVILGSGFAGSLTALILRQIGRRVILVDKAKHPRFAIGESSTPVANLLIRDLAAQYDLPRVAPLAKYGTWCAARPELLRGLKRGFSYFAQRPGKAFVPSASHENELLVAASSDDEHGDTHWLRADVDQFLCQEAVAAGTLLLEETQIESLHHLSPGHWSLACVRGTELLRIATPFVIDGTGEGSVLPRALGLSSEVGRLHTHSRAVFSHFHGVRDWEQLLRQAGGLTVDHPFPCDLAAQHHVLEGAWMWMLRFDRGLTSAGFTLDPRRYPLAESWTPEQEWNQWLQLYPGVAAMFDQASLAERPARILRSGRLQRCWSAAAGPDWALLPHTAGFIDPLHSSGIAHSLCGIERLTSAIDKYWGRAELAAELRDYDRIVREEIDLIDQLVAGCYATFDRFPLFVAYSMLYFAAATTFERRRAAHQTGAFLGADCRPLREAVAWALHQVTRPEGLSAEVFFDELAAAMQPFNQVGLWDRSVRNMYRHTVAPA